MLFRSGIFDRAPKGDWLKRWILNNEKLIKSGDAYANKIYNENGKAAMTVFEGQLTDKDVDAILDYIKNPPADNSTLAKTTTNVDTDPVITDKGIDPLYLILGCIVLLSVLLIAFRSIRISLYNANQVSEGREPLPDMTLWQIGRAHV